MNKLNLMLEYLKFIKESEYRVSIPKYKNELTIDKIKKYLRNLSSTSGSSELKRVIKKFDSPEELQKHIFYHGSANFIKNLKPGALLPKNTKRGGGYEDMLHSISLSSSRNVASNFTSDSRSGIVYPVILKKGAKIISRPDLTDSNELEDILIELWKDNIDGVLLGDHSQEYSERELAILNPRAIHLLKGFGFAVFNKPVFDNLSFEEIKTMWEEAHKN